MKKFLFLMLVLLLSQLKTELSFSNEWDDFRNHEAMLLTGLSLSSFKATPVNDMFFYSYRESDNSWRQITFQVDELDGGKGYFNAPNYNGIIDDVDEFLFMAGDAGDYAPPSSWIDDNDSKSYVRNQIEIINPDDPLTKKYVYVYRSSTLVHDPGLPYYIKYIAPVSGVSDTVITAAYIEGHNAKGIPDLWRIADSTGVFGKDLLDRQKARVKGKYKPLPFWTVSYDLDEDNLNAAIMEYKRGPIRIIRDVSYKVEVSGTVINVGTFRYRYYPYRIVSEGADKKIDSDYGVSLIRQSFDLDSVATGMLFNNADNINLKINGLPDSVNNAIYPAPVMNWSMYSGSPGTVVMLNEFTPPANASYQLYYHESLTNSTGDGTDDTGDLKSFGDNGIIFQGSKINGSISLPYFNYFLPGSHPREVGAKLAYQAKNPLTRDHALQNYIAPAQIAISLPDTSGPAQYPISIPVLIGNASGLNILSSELAIQFDSQILQARGISLINTLVENWDSTAVRVSNDTIFVAMQGGTALQNSGVLCYLNFFVIGSEAQHSPLHFVRTKFNIWNPLALPTDGNFSALAAPTVDVSIADTTLKSGESLHLPVTISFIKGLELRKYSIGLTFNQAILQFEAVDTTATIASGWERPVTQYNPGMLSIAAIGSTPLQHPGALIYLNFKVIGPDASSTIIHFSTMSFNSGQYSANTTDGKVFVSGVVPVELSSFSATNVDNDVKLHWMTATESNNFGFFIQRTNDVKVDWQTIGFVSGKGTTASPQSYVFVDTDVASRTWYYRLQQQDLDGQIHFSQAIEVSLLPTQSALYQNYPNPFNSSTLIKYDLPVGENQVRLVIYDLLGQQIRTLLDKENQPAGAYQIIWDGRDDAGRTVASGVYFYHLQVGQQSFIKKMVLIE